MGTSIEADVVGDDPAGRNERAITERRDRRGAGSDLFVMAVRGRVVVIEAERRSAISGPGIFKVYHRWKTLKNTKPTLKVHDRNYSSSPHAPHFCKDNLYNFLDNLSSLEEESFIHFTR